MLGGLTKAGFVPDQLERLPGIPALLQDVAEQFLVLSEKIVCPAALLRHALVETAEVAAIVEEIGVEPCTLAKLERDGGVNAR